jgi:pyridoxamine 5'-phosphate oxidase
MSSIIKKILIRLLLNTAGRYAEEARLHKARIPAEPLELFSQWFSLAKEIDPERYNAMTLATADASSRPSARMVLLKEFDVRGFVFFTNYGSRKAQELAVNPQAALDFWWKEIYRQVRIEGTINKLDDAASDAYFQSRSRGSQIGAWASRQSSILTNRTELKNKVDHFRNKFKGQDVPRPPFWGGYCLRPTDIDFWQGRQDRLHDRLHYSLTANGKSWQIDRLSP